MRYYIVDIGFEIEIDVDVDFILKLNDFQR